MTVGAFVALRVRPRHLLRYGLISMLGTTLPLLAIARSSPLTILLAAFFLGGLALEQFTVAWDTSMQRHVPPGSLARVTSYDALGSYIGMPVGEVAAGPIAQWIGTGEAILSAAVIVVIAVVAMLSSREVRSLGTPSART